MHLSHRFTLAMNPLVVSSTFAFTHMHSTKIHHTNYCHTNHSLLCQPYPGSLPASLSVSLISVYRTSSTTHSMTGCHQIETIRNYLSLFHQSTVFVYIYGISFYLPSFLSFRQTFNKIGIYIHQMVLFSSIEYTVGSFSSNNLAVND